MRDGGAGPPCWPSPRQSPQPAACSCSGGGEGLLSEGEGGPIGPPQGAGVRGTVAAALLLHWPCSGSGRCSAATGGCCRAAGCWVATAAGRYHCPLWLFLPPAVAATVVPVVAVAAAAAAGHVLRYMVAGHISKHGVGGEAGACGIEIELFLDWLLTHAISDQHEWMR